VKRWVALAGAALAAVTAAAAPAGIDAPSRIVDRTSVCTPIAYGGIGDLDVFANPPEDLNFDRPISAYLIVRTGGSRPDTNLVLVRRRSQVRYPGLTDPQAVGGPGGVFAHSQRCASTRVRVALSSKGLPGPPIRFEKDVDCPVRGRVLVRVRAVLQAPAEWRRAERPYVGARQSVAGASVAVRSQRTGAPIAFMQLDKAGNSKLWFSPNCS
jgi:hypothetical protein